MKLIDRCETCRYSDETMCTNVKLYNILLPDDGKHDIYINDPAEFGCIFWEEKIKYETI